MMRRMMCVAVAMMVAGCGEDGNETQHWQKVVVKESSQTREPLAESSRLGSTDLKTALQEATTRLAATVPDDVRPVIKAGTVEEFVAAIGPDRIIELEEKEYDLSKVKRGAGKHVAWEEAMEDEYELVIQDVANLTIRGPMGKQAHVVTPNRYCQVLSFKDCVKIGLEHVKLGHKVEKGFCIGGVVRAVNVKGMTIASSVLYGCGTEGLHLMKVEGLAMRDTVVEECTYGLARFEKSRNLTFTRCTFRNSGEFYGIDLQGTTGVTFKDCTVADNRLKRPVFMNNLNDPADAVVFSGGVIKGNTAKALSNQKEMLRVENTEVVGNSWQE